MIVVGSFSTFIGDDKMWGPWLTWAHVCGLGAQAESMKMFVNADMEDELFRKDD